MSNNISGNDAKLGKLFESVGQDTPELSRDELLALISNETRNGASSMRQNNTQRSKRRVAVMSIVTAVILTAFYFLFNSAPESGKVQQGETRARIGSSTQQLRPSADATPIRDAEPKNDPSVRVSTLSDEASVQTEQKPEKRPADIDPKRWEMFIHRPIDLVVFKPVDVDEDKLASLGLLRSDSGEVIYYHKDYKFGFPIFDYIRQFIDDPDTNRKILGRRPFYAKYVTDSRGSMMLHYENKQISNGNSVSLGIYDRDLLEEIKKLKYFAAESQSTETVLDDSVNRISKRRIVVRAGIMWIDTVITGGYADQHYFGQVTKYLQLRVRHTDSVLKIGLGGMDAIAQKYAFDLSDTSDPLASIVLAEYKKSSTQGKSQMQILADRMGVVFRLIMRRSSIEERLKLEQLSIKLAYEAYLERSKEEAAELANPVDLVAMRVRPSTGLKVNPKFDNGLIFWYRDSDSLRLVLNTNRSSVRTFNDPKVKLSVMPNPAMLYLYLDYSVEEATPLRVTLADITGKQVYTEAWKASAGRWKKEINVQQIPAGIYMLVLDSEKGRTTRQVIIQHR